jgi:hypothetical protein
MKTRYIATSEPIQHRLNATVGNNGGKYDLFDYATAYLDASIALANKVKKEGMITDTVVYPICYTFRHGVELFVKYLIDDLGRLAGTRDEYKQSHKLSRNWKRAKRLLPTIETSAEEIQFIDNVVKDLDRLDSTGMTFRYPETIDRNLLINDLETINIAVIANNCTGVSEIATTWGRRVYGVMESAADQRTLAPDEMRPIAKGLPITWWRRFLRSAAEMRRRFMPAK